MQYKELQQIYDNFYARAREIAEQYNPCAMDDNKVCVKNRVMAVGGKKNIYYGCCGDPLDRDIDVKCKYLVPGEGCTTECLLCALMYCPFAEDNLPQEIRGELNRMIQEAYKLGLMGFREPKAITIVRATIPDSSGND